MTTQDILDNLNLELGTCSRVLVQLLTKRAEKNGEDTLTAADMCYLVPYADPRDHQDCSLYHALIVAGCKREGDFRNLIEP